MHVYVRDEGCLCLKKAGASVDLSFSALLGTQTRLLGPGIKWLGWQDQTWDFQEENSTFRRLGKAG